MKRHHIYALLMMILISLVFAAFLIFISLSTRLDDLSHHEIKDINLQEIDDGIYHGKSNTNPVYIEVNVTVDDDEITDISVIDYNVFIDQEQLELVTNMVYQNQSIDFDISAYDTYTAVALLDAISHALN